MRILINYVLYMYYISISVIIITPQLLMAVQVLFSPMVSGLAFRWEGGRQEKACSWLYLRNGEVMILILNVRDMAHGVTSFDLVVVTLIFKILYRLYLRICKMQEVDTWKEYWLGGAADQDRELLV